MSETMTESLARDIYLRLDETVFEPTACRPQCDGVYFEQKAVEAVIAEGIAAALSAAEARGREAALEACKQIADDHARDAGDRAARGFYTSEERAARSTARSIASAIALTTPEPQ